MTATVIVKADRGAPVKVTRRGDDGVACEQIVPAAGEDRFAVWDGADLVVHEIQPREPEFARSPPPKIGGV